MNLRSLRVVSSQYIQPKSDARVHVIAIFRSLTKCEAKDYTKKGLVISCRKASKFVFVDSVTINNPLKSKAAKWLQYE